MFLEKIREVEGGRYPEPTGKWQNFVADPFLDGKPMKLKMGVIWSGFFCFLFFSFHDSSCSSILHCL